jgi:hypothetical protein
MATCLISCCGLSCEDSLLFYKSWHNGVHNYLNTCLYDLWNTLILILMHSITFFSRFVFDEFIAKGGEYGHKVGRTLANQVDERKNMINDYLRGRACIESIRGSWFQGVLILSFCFGFEPFLLFWAFLSSSLPFCLALPLFMPLLAFAAFLLTDDLFELFVGFWSSNCASWGLRFEHQTLCFYCQRTH